jgi:hypothetical protein
MTDPIDAADAMAGAGGDTMPAVAVAAGAAALGETFGSGSCAGARGAVADTGVSPWAA